MLVLIDESGDTGFKLTKNSSPFFTIGMVVFANLVEAEKASKHVAELRDKLRIGQEFKFSKSRSSIKDRFFYKICKYDFLVHALVVDKKNIYSDYIRENKENFYKTCMKRLMQNDNKLLKNVRIKIDGSGTNMFRIALRKYLQNHIGNQKIISLKFVDSKRDNLIQLADIVIGAVARSHDSSRKDHKRWLNILESRGKIANIWSFK
ncbi:MAG: DUF3800 domain-containing protein [Gammaproteobacteria bacterium]